MKLDIQTVATRQVESAVWMYAYDYDEVAVHVVAASAFELTTKRLNSGGQKDVVEKHIRPEKLTEFYRVINKPYNFFKHGEHDYEKLEFIEYEADSVEYLILNACQANLAGPKEFRLECARIFMSYFAFKHPELVNENYRKQIELALKQTGLTLSEIQSRTTLKLWLGNVKNPILKEI